ncbi:MAG: ROK family protein [Verrucomicrobia bacterium]|nr:ROK family protein [Verrucomicrobiota bacterium]
MKNRGLSLVAPRVTPVLDPFFRPAALANRHYRQQVQAANAAIAVELGLEQSDGSVSRFATHLFREDHPLAEGNFVYVERLLKFLLWSRGGFRVYLAGPKPLAEQLQHHYQHISTGLFDARLMGERIHERPFEVVHCAAGDIPPARVSSAPLGRHLEGCRIGFDLGGSDRKVAAVIDGKPVFSEEVAWDPTPQSDPQWHFDQIMDSIQRAAGHLPRVDAVGGSAAGVYVNNRVKVASLFRGVPPEVFNRRVKDLFLELKVALGNVPFEVVNDGEVTALAGSMALGANAVLGIALGTSMAGGYVTPDGKITSWLNELAFAPVDYQPRAPVDEWSGDYGCGVQYFSQQAVGRLLAVAGIELDPALPLPEKLKHVQGLMLEEDYRAQKIYHTIGTYLGYALAHYADFYEFRHVLILGRVTSGPGGNLIIDVAREVLAVDFPEVSTRITFHVPDEKDKRHGQAIAAASLPALQR